jgi:thiol-disulfide isomerase/thioredoxin
MPALHNFSGASAWVNSGPPELAELQGNVVLVHFWTLTCINWLRTAPHVRAWSRAYRDDGLVVLGIHTPEFAFERDIQHVQQATLQRGLDHAVAVDNDYAIWDAFDNHYWPALYFIDRAGRRQGQHVGEGGYEKVERTLQRLLDVHRPLVTVQGVGVEADADWRHLGSHETYLGYNRTTDFASANGAPVCERQHFRLPEHLPLNHWGLNGEWTIGQESVVLHQPGGSLAFRFRARDVHLVLSAPAEKPIPFRVRIDDGPPGRVHGVDVDDDGYGVLAEGRMYQLARATDDVRERVVEVSFSRPGVQAYVFTFG